MPNAVLSQMKNRIRSVVFDMDGVLILSTGIHESAFRTTLQAWRPEFDYSDYAGMRTREAVEAILAANDIFLGAGVLDALAVAKSRAALTQLEAGNPVAPHALDVLYHLHGRYSLGLASSASAASLSAFIDRNDLRPVFSSVISGDQVREAKPAPEIYKRAIDELGTPPELCLVVEDAVAGVRAARAAGAIPSAVPGTASPEALRCAGATFVLSGLEELLEL